MILADGRNRSVLTFNNQLPGPLLVVCEGDTVQVTLKNEIIDGPITNSDGSPFSTTLHFHGIREVGRRDQNEQVFGPWSDGVPFSPLSINVQLIQVKVSPTPSRQPHLTQKRRISMHLQELIGTIVILELKGLMALKEA